jgi:D-alanine-D-alanine ligase
MTTMSVPSPRSPSRVAVLYGGPSPEHDVSILTGLQAVRALAGVRSVVHLRSLYWSKSGDWYEVDPDLEAPAFADGPPHGAGRVELVLGERGGFVVRHGGLRPRTERLELDAVLVCCHGGPGEDGSLQAALDLAGIAYSGPTVAGAALGMDKLAFGALVRLAGLPALDRVQLTDDGGAAPFGGPCIVKPRFGGSSIGIDVVADHATAVARLRANVHLRRGAVLEPYRPDLHDLQIAVRTWPEVQLSAIERPLKGSSAGEILGYAEKYVGGEGMAGAPRELPALLPEKLAEQIRAMALEVTSLAGVRGVARIDFLSDGEQLYVNEVNTVPGSLSRHMFVDPPLAFGELLAGLLAEAVERPSARFSTAGADGTLLRGAGSIAAKLA